MGITAWYIRIRERMVRFERAQDMTEYALILAAIAIVVFAAYEIMGQSISTLASGVDSTLSNA
jgi:Flp pilus assembly pilin Flp